MPVGPTGGALNSSFRTRDTPEYKLELGIAVESVARIVPDGLLVFFPSYAVMSGCVDAWRSPGGASVWCEPHELPRADAYIASTCGAGTDFHDSNTSSWSRVNRLGWRPRVSTLKLSSKVAGYIALRMHAACRLTQPECFFRSCSKRRRFVCSVPRQGQRRPRLRRQSGTRRHDHRHGSDAAPTHTAASR